MDPGKSISMSSGGAVYALAPKTLSEAMEFADMISKSEMVPKAYRGKPADILVAVQMGAELGIKPLQALQNIACIDGRPCIYGDLLLALVQASGQLESLHEEQEEGGAICTVKRRGREPVTQAFSLQDAQRAGLTSKDNWKKYPRRMSQWRARAYALRDAFPDVLKGLAIREEVEDNLIVEVEDPIKEPESSGAEVSNEPPVQEVFDPLAQSEGSQGEKISQAQVDTLFTLAIDLNLPEGVCREILGEFGFENSRDITVERLDQVIACFKTEAEKRNERAQSIGF